MILRTIRGLYQRFSIFHLRAKPFNIKATRLNIVLKVCYPGFILLLCDEIRDKISKRKVCSSPCSVKNGRGDVIYRHGCQITGSSCGEVEAMCFPLYSSLQHSTLWCCVLSWGGVEGVRTWAVSLSAHGERKLHLSARPVICPVPFLLVHPSLSSTHLSSINLRCLSDAALSSSLLILPCLIRVLVPCVLYAFVKGCCRQF